MKLELLKKYKIWVIIKRNEKYLETQDINVSKFIYFND